MLQQAMISGWHAPGSVDTQLSYSNLRFERRVTVAAPAKHMTLSPLFEFIFCDIKFFRETLQNFGGKSGEKGGKSPGPETAKPARSLTERASLVVGAAGFEPTTPSPPGPYYLLLSMAFSEINDVFRRKSRGIVLETVENRQSCAVYCHPQAQRLLAKENLSLLGHQCSAAIVQNPKRPT
jgi:hypothetical protein